MSNEAKTVVRRFVEHVQNNGNIEAAGEFIAGGVEGSTCSAIPAQNEAGDDFWQERPYR